MNLRLLAAIAAVELGSLLVLVINLATVHVPVVATILGPLHGCAYVAMIVGSAVHAGPRSLPTLLSIIPAAGGALSIAALRRRASAPEADHAGRASGRTAGRPR